MITLLTAFEPFDIDPENSSALVLAEMVKRSSNGVRTAILPVSFERAKSELRRLLREINPDVVVALGQADSRAKVTVEEIALNLIEARIADADGAQPYDQLIAPGEPLARRSRLPVRGLVEGFLRSGVECEISYTAGTYVCNAVMYEVLRWADDRQKQAGFIHLPLAVGQKLGSGREDRRPIPRYTPEQLAHALTESLSLQGLISES